MSIKKRIIDPKLVKQAEDKLSKVFLDLMKDSGYVYDPINPIKFKKKFDPNLN